MKLSGFEVYQLGEPGAGGGATQAGNSIILKLTTSNGIVGYGEAVPTLRVRPVIQSIREVWRVYRGPDPFSVESNLREWHKHDFYLPVSFESTTVLSAFDIACWDIIGKSLGVPIHRITGGSFRKRVRNYLKGWYSGCVKPDQFGSKARFWVKKGYTALKFDPFGNYYDFIDRRGLEEAYERVRAVRDSTGGKVELLIEYHGRFNPNSAIMVARKLSVFDLLFMEEPVHPEDIDGLRKYRRRTDVRVALGKRVLKKEYAAYLMSNDLASYSHYCDILAFDFYPNYKSPSPLNVSVFGRAEQAAKALGRPVLIIETGYPSGPFLLGYDEKKQVDYVRAACMEAHSLDGVNGLGIWRYADSSWRFFPDQENHFGLLDSG